jgi:pentapeptide MXKDX repeat protein
MSSRPSRTLRNATFPVALAFVVSLAVGLLTTPASAQDSIPPRPPQDTIKRDTVKRDTTKRDTVKRDTVKRDTTRRDTTARDTTKADSAKAAAPVVRRPPSPRALTAEEIARARRDSILDSKWPVKGPDPLPGAILPHKRIVAYYGNPLSKRMGVMGEYPVDSMLAMLDAEVKAWELADPSTPVVPALHLIAVVAQGSAGRDGKYRLRMADTLIERVASWAARRDALVFLDVQVGLSTLEEELPRLEKWLSRPNFHLGIDPEFSMKNGGLPGKRIGTFDAKDINFATAWLSAIVHKYQVPPKVFVIHRFTQRGVTNYQDIRLDPAVQIVMHMDGFGKPWLKRNTFREYIKAEPVQFVGWKQFYKAKNDNPRTTIKEILALNPKVVYIQYQ